MQSSTIQTQFQFIYNFPCCQGGSRRACESVPHKQGRIIGAVMQVLKSHSTHAGTTGDKVVDRTRDLS